MAEVFGCVLIVKDGPFSASFFNTKDGPFSASFLFFICLFNTP